MRDDKVERERENPRICTGVTLNFGFSAVCETSNGSNE